VRELGIRAMLSPDERMELERIFKKANLKIETDLIDSSQSNAQGS
jgi:hypothetical protein